MTEFHPSLRTVLSWIPAVSLGLSGCALVDPRYGWRVETDAEFQAMVARAMPNYRLTSAIIGRPVLRSPGFALLLVDPGVDARTVVRNFLTQFEDTGLPPVRIYLRSSARTLF